MYKFKLHFGGILLFEKMGNKRVKNMEVRVTSKWIDEESWQ